MSVTSWATCLCLPSPSVVKRRALKYWPTRAKASLPNTCKDGAHRSGSLCECFGIYCATRCLTSWSQFRYCENVSFFHAGCHRGSKC